MPPSNRAPTAILTGPTSAHVGETIRVDASGSTDPDDVIRKWSIYWGDGDKVAYSGPLGVADHVYAELGTYDIVLTVSDAKRSRDTARLTIEIVAVPVPVDCVLSEWSAWSCTPWVVDPDDETKERRTCTRTRTILVEPAHGGKACGPTEEVDEQVRDVEPPPTGKPHPYFDKLVASEWHHAHFSFRDQAQNDAATQRIKGMTWILRSTAETPAVVTAGRAKNSGGHGIVSSRDGVLTLDEKFGQVGSGATFTVNVVGHDMPGVDGVHEVQYLSGNDYKIVDATIVGTGAGGNAYRGHHSINDGARIVVDDGHDGFDAGTYVARVVNGQQFKLYTLDGQPVAGRGGGEGGSIFVTAWDHFPSTPGRVDPDAPAWAGGAMDAAKACVPLYQQGGDVVQPLHVKFPPVNDGVVVHVWNVYHAKTMVGVGCPSKVWRWDNGQIVQGWHISRARLVKVSRVEAGTPGRLICLVPHIMETGTLALTAGVNGVPDGEHRVTVIDPLVLALDGVTIPTSGGSGGGTITDPRVYARFNGPHGTGGGGARNDALMWLLGYDVSGDTLVIPTGERGVPASRGMEGVYPVWTETWTRSWLVERQAVTGLTDDALPNFSGWNRSVIERKFGPGRKVGVWDVDVVVDAAGVATVTCRDGAHGYGVGEDVVLTGPAPGRFVIDTVAGAATNPLNGGFSGPNAFTVKGAPPNVAGPGQSALLLNLYSYVRADEERKPIVVYDRIPRLYARNRTLFNHEHDSSNDQNPLSGQPHWYEVDHAILANYPLRNDDPLADVWLFEQPTRAL